MQVSKERLKNKTITLLLISYLLVVFIQPKLDIGQRSNNSVTGPRVDTDQIAGTGLRHKLTARAAPVHAEFDGSFT